MKVLKRCTLAALAALSAACSPAEHAASTAHLGLATWNLEWLMTPAEHQRLASRCTDRQPASDERALPCTPGRKPPPQRHQADLDALASTAQALRDAHRVTVVALQETDGPQAAAQVFRQGWRLDCFTDRAHPQKVGFAIRDGVPYRCNGDLTALDIDGHTRAGADLTLWPGTAQAVRVLNVHLKSGCFTGRLDRTIGPCASLREQVPVVESWIDDRVREGAAFVVMGDFNRHLATDARFPAGSDEDAPLNVMQAWSDDQPRGAVLRRATEDQPYMPCHPGERHRQYIDDILIDQRLAQRYMQRHFSRITFEDQPPGRVLSDHCPVVWSLLKDS